MSRLVADQENRGDDGNSGAGERDSVMRMNLAEGCRGVNAAPGGAEREARDRREMRDLNRVYSYPSPACPASRACLAPLCGRVVLIGCFFV